MNRYASALAGIVTLAASIGIASAADLARPGPYPTKAPPLVAGYNWTGFYAGINGGGAWGTSNWGLPGSFDTHGALVGGTLGYNWQFGQFVYGLEGDADWSNIRGSSLIPGAGCTGPGIAPGTGCSIGMRNDFLATARGRVGLAIDRWMPYVTGGLAVGNLRTTNVGLGGIDQTNAGWTVGGGIEFALPANWTAKVEYLYVDLGNASCSIGCGIGPTNVGLTTNVVRGGLNYRF